MIILRRCIIKSIILIIAIVIIASCGKSELTPEDARKELAKLNIQYNEASYYDAIINNDKLVVELLLKTGMSPNIVFSKKDIGATPIILATYNNDTELVKLFIANGADINYKYSLDQKDEVTPLYFSILNLNYENCKLLIDKGATLDITGEGLTANQLLERMIRNKKYYPAAGPKLMDKKMEEKAKNIYELFENQDYNENMKLINIKGIDGFKFGEKINPSNMGYVRESNDGAKDGGSTIWFQKGDMRLYVTKNNIFYEYTIQLGSYIRMRDTLTKAYGKPEEDDASWLHWKLKGNIEIMLSTSGAPYVEVTDKSIN